MVEAKAGGHAIGGKEGVLTQLSEAMDFRQATGGIVVVTKEHAGKRQRTFDRRGSDRIIVVVDPDDNERGFLSLEVAYTVLRERILAAERKEAEGRADFQEMENAVARIENALAAVQSMKVNCTSAKDTIDKLRTSIEQMEDAIRDQLRTLRRQVAIGGVFVRIRPCILAVVQTRNRNGNSLSARLNRAVSCPFDRRKARYRSVDR